MPNITLYIRLTFDYKGKLVGHGAEVYRSRPCNPNRTSSFPESVMQQDLNQLSRTCYCGEVGTEHAEHEVVLKGWAQSQRDHGGLIFVALRDREGIVQIVFDPAQLSAEEFDLAHRIRSEDVLALRGQVRIRPEGSENSNLKTGKIEVLVQSFEILARSDVLPFKIDEFSHASEDIRLTYRYLDLRRPEMQHYMKSRTKLVRTIRRYLDECGFLEFETPILTRSTPEGARDFLVPSRMNQGSFYALPQSPQLFKQILMISGFDKYYQIARCFRDEDLRANRQPEFTQVDIEMSFITREDIYRVIEGMMVAIYREMKDIELKSPFRRMIYDEAMLKYGSDKPDLRFALEIQDVTPILSGSEFKAFNSVFEKGGVARALCVPGGGEKYSNTQLKPGGELPEHASRFGAKGLAWFKAESGEGSKLTLASNIAKFFKPETLDSLAQAFDAKPGDLVLIIVDDPKVAANAMGQMRLKIGRDFGLMDPNAVELCWITDFPMVEWDQEEKKWSAMNHPFTSPWPDHFDLLESDPPKARALAYDLALNGEEVGGGSIRIHRPDLQQRVFSVLGIPPERAESQFGFLLKALSFGAPPHGGIAFGVERLLMMLLGTDSIRDVIPFPKTQSGTCLMTSAPSPVDAQQLKTLGIRTLV